MGLTLVPSQGPSTGYLSFWNHFEIFSFFQWSLDAFGYNFFLGRIGLISNFSSVAKNTSFVFKNIDILCMYHT